MTPKEIRPLPLDDTDPERRIRELEARQLELVLIVKELIMELNKAYGVEA